MEQTKTTTNKLTTSMISSDEWQSAYEYLPYQVKEYEYLIEIRKPPILFSISYNSLESDFHPTNHLAYL
jgi:hypothetical protein